MELVARVIQKGIILRQDQGFGGGGGGGGGEGDCRYQASVSSSILTIVTLMTFLFRVNSTVIIIFAGFHLQGGLSE